MKRSRSKDLTTFSCLYDCYAPGLWGMILIFTKDTFLAEEILEESFVSIWKRLEEYDPARGGLFSWMVSIAINHCVCRLHLSKSELMEGLKYFISSKQTEGMNND